MRAWQSRAAAVRGSAATLVAPVVLSFQDDGPSIDVTTAGEADSLVVDETNLGLNASANFADNFGDTHSFGTDGEGSLTTTYSLGISASGADSGLDDVATGLSVNLYLIDGVVVGSTALTQDAVNAGNTVFTVSVDDDGTVTLEIGLIIGVALLFIGVGVAIYAVTTWGALDFGELSPSIVMRYVIASGTSILLGLQVIYAAFFMRVLEIRGMRPIEAPE